MKDDKKYLLELLDKKELSFSEKSWLLNYVENTDQETLVKILEGQFTNSVNTSQATNPERSIKMLAEIHQKIGQPGTRPKIFQLWIKRVAVAACFVGIMTTGVLYLVKKTLPILLQITIGLKYFRMI